MILIFFFSFLFNRLKQEPIKFDGLLTQIMQAGRWWHVRLDRFVLSRSKEKWCFSLREELKVVVSTNFWIPVKDYPLRDRFELFPRQKCEKCSFCMPDTKNLTRNSFIGRFQTRDGWSVWDGYSIFKIGQNWQKNRWIKLGGLFIWN